MTLLKDSVEVVIDLAQRAGLRGIEWSGKVHVPHGDLVSAAKTRRLTRAAGLEVASYGSYYRAGVSETDATQMGRERLTFASVLHTAMALGAPNIRVWAGNCNHDAADEATLDRVVADTLRIASMAQQAGLTITFEFHEDSLTHTADSALQFASRVQHPAVHLSWQPPHGEDAANSLAGLARLLPWLNTVHVFQWSPVFTPGGRQLVRHPLADGASRWQRYVQVLNASPRDHFLLLEFVRDDAHAQLLDDARSLHNLLASPAHHSPT